MFNAKGEKISEATPRSCNFGVWWDGDPLRELLDRNVIIYTLMHDPQYRLSVAWQNVAYNQPPHTSFYLGEGMAKPPRPAIAPSQYRER